MKYLTTKEAAAVLGVSTRHIQRLIVEADTSPKTSRWKWGRELINLSPMNAVKRTIRISPYAFSELAPKQHNRPLDKKTDAQRRVNRRYSNGDWPSAKVFKCSKCEAQAEHYHHEDYELWWSVEPLCRSCHTARHWELKKNQKEPLPPPEQQ